MQTHSIHPLAFFGSLKANRALLWQLARRDVAGRYRGSVLGLAWSFINPLLMLAIYTFVFTQIFTTRLPAAASHGGGIADYALFLFAGILVHVCAMECFHRAPGLILSHANYVKKVVFPLEILPVVTLCAALFHFVMAGSVLWIAALLLGKFPGVAALGIFLLIPFALFVLGVSWVLASLGVYLRDIGQAMGIVGMVLMFTSPVFYAKEALPEKLAPLLYLNPLTLPMEGLRAFILGFPLPGVGHVVAYCGASVLMAWLGFAWFQRTRKGFADVL